MNRLISASALLLVSCVSALPAAAQFTVLHQFTSGPNDGEEPHGRPVVIGDNLFGTTVYGGDSGAGTVYRIKTDGTGLQLLHEFAGPEGTHPLSAPLVIGSTIYATALEGGSSDSGTIVRVNTDGTAFGTLHTFVGSSAGRWPQTELVLAGGILYGTTRTGGTFGNGTIYKMNLDGSNFQILHHMSGATDGSQPHELIVDGSTIYAGAVGGGSGDGGVVFKLNTDGSGFQSVHNFTRGGPGGSFLATSPILIGSTLYGTTVSGGANGTGAIFKMNTDGSGFSVIHDFATIGITWNSQTRLIASGSTLYGMTGRGGAADSGTIFKIQTDGTGFQTLHQFAFEEGYSVGKMTLDGSTLYGIKRYGGQFGEGTLFSFVVPEPSAAGLAMAAIFLLGAILPRGKVNRG